MSTEEGATSYNIFSHFSDFYKIKKPKLSLQGYENQRTNSEKY